MGLNQNQSLSGQALWEWRSEKLSELANLHNRVTSAHTRAELAGELDWLLREVTGLDRLELRLGLFQSRPALTSTHSLMDLETLWQKRIRSGVPLQYLLGRTTWRNFVLKVSPAVLIPRPETEQIIDIAAAQAKFKDGVWLDLGTGSGAIAFGLAEIFPNARIYGVDVSAAALAIAQENSVSLGFSDRIQFCQGSWFEALPRMTDSIQGICSNPPYIPTDLIQTLQPEVRNHEPHLALDGGVDGLAVIRSLIQQAQQYLCPQGLLLLECMAGQGKAIANLMTEQDYQSVQIHYDLAGCDRFIQGFKAEERK